MGGMGGGFYLGGYGERVVLLWKSTEMEEHDVWSVLSSEPSQCFSYILGELFVLLACVGM